LHRVGQCQQHDQIKWIQLYQFTFSRQSQSDNEKRIHQDRPNHFLEQRQAQDKHVPPNIMVIHAQAPAWCVPREYRTWFQQPLGTGSLPRHASAETHTSFTFADYPESRIPSQYSFSGPPGAVDVTRHTCANGLCNLQQPPILGIDQLSSHLQLVEDTEAART